MKGFYSIFATILASLALAVVVYGILSLSNAHSGELMLLQGRLVDESSKDTLQYLNDTIDDALFDIAWQACPCGTGTYDETGALARLNGYATVSKQNLSLFNPVSQDVTFTGVSVPASLVCNSEGDFHFYATLHAHSGNVSRVLRGVDLGKKVRVTIGTTLDIVLFNYDGTIHREAHVSCAGGTTTTTLGGGTTTTTVGGPDIVTSFFPPSGSGSPGDTLNFVVRTRNQGTANSIASTTELTGPQPESFSIGPLSPGSFVDSAFSFTCLGQGMFTITSVGDSEFVVSESSELNNGANLVISCLAFVDEP